MVPQRGRDLPPQPLGPDFRRLWAGQTVSLLGTEVTSFALPLTAVLALGATPGQMGVLVALGAAPSLVVTLAAGVWVDRLRRRPLLIAADLARVFLLGSVPVAALLGALTMAQLYVVGFLASACAVLHGVAYGSYLPSLVPRDRLAEANGRLALSAEGAAVAGPGLAGGLVALLTAPVAVAADALSYLLSALLVSRIRVPEPRPEGRTADRHALAEIREGLEAVLRQPVLRALAVSWAVFELSSAAIGAVFLLYVTRELAIAPAVLGALLTVGSVSALAGAALAGRLARRIGVGRAIGVGLSMLVVDAFITPLAGVFPSAALPLLLAAEVIVRPGFVIAGVNQTTLRQALAPDPLRGRVNASFGFLTAGVAPVGALLGGLLGEGFGTWAALVVGGIGMLLAAGLAVASPVGRVRSLPGASPGE